MKKGSNKRKTKVTLPKIYIDFSNTKPPTRPAIESMINNLRYAAK